MRARTLTVAALVVAALGGATLAACDLNPQPLPPGDPTSDLSPGSGENEDASTSGGFGSDAAAAPPSNEAGDGGDAGDTRDDDAGDAGDAGDGRDGGDAAPEASISD